MKTRARKSRSGDRKERGAKAGVAVVATPLGASAGEAGGVAAQAVGVEEPAVGVEDVEGQVDEVAARPADSTRRRCRLP